MITLTRSNLEIRVLDNHKEARGSGRVLVVSEAALVGSEPNLVKDQVWRGQDLEVPVVLRDLQPSLREVLDRAAADLDPARAGSERETQTRSHKKVLDKVLVRVVAVLEVPAEVLEATTLPGPSKVSKLFR